MENGERNTGTSAMLGLNRGLSSCPPMDTVRQLAAVSLLLFGLAGSASACEGEIGAAETEDWVRTATREAVARGLPEAGVPQEQFERFEPDLAAVEWWWQRYRSSVARTDVIGAQSRALISGDGE